MDFGSQIRFVQAHKPLSGIHVRVNCPSCGGQRTLSIGSETGQLKWMCFRAKCHVRGIQRVTRTAEEIRSHLRRSVENPKAIQPFAVPDHFCSAIGNDEVRRYLQYNHCLDAYTKRLCDIRYDPKLHRVVFLVTHNGVIIDGAGRALTKGAQPKWYRYASSDYPFICGTSDVAVVVEDCASACAVSGVATGVALLGTNLKNTYIPTLRRFKGLIVALDADASRKALDLSRTLSYFCPTTVAKLDDDLKYLSEDQIRQKLAVPLSRTGMERRDEAADNNRDRQ